MYKYLFIGETKIVLYQFLNTLSAIALLVYNLIRVKYKKEILTYPAQALVKKASCCKKDKSNFVATTFAIIEIVIMTLIVILCLSNLNVMFSKVVGTGMNYFGTLYTISAIFCLLFVILKTNPLKQMDFLATAFPLTMIITKLACFCSGCCNGIEWKYGLYNHGMEEYQVPIQLIEALWALLIFIYLRKYQKTAKPGTMFPMYTILYCSTRFFSEFLSGEPNTFGIFKTYHILCAIGIAYGLLQYFVAVKFGDKITNYYDNKSKKFALDK